MDMELQQGLIEISTPNSQFNEARFNELPRFSEQMPAPLNYLL